MIGVVLLLVRIEPRRLALPAVLIALTLVLIVFIDAQFIGGFRPLDSGDDGLTYEGYARRIVRHLLSGDFAAALRGEEYVYFFAPGMRYVRAARAVLFGDTFLGYLSMILAFPLIVHALFARFLTPRWALVIVLLFVATPLGALFGSSLFYYVVWASRGFADPLAFILLFAAIVLMVPPAKRRTARHVAPVRGRPPVRGGDVLPAQPAAGVGRDGRRRRRDVAVAAPARPRRGAWRRVSARSRCRRCTITCSPMSSCRSPPARTCPRPW